MTAVPTPLPARPLAARPGEPPWNRLGEPTLGLESTPVVSAVLAVVTLGLLPAVLWPFRWSTLLERERGFYRELTGWWRRRADDPADAAKLDPVLAELRPRPVMVVLPWLAALFIVLTGAVLRSANRFDPHSLWAATFGYDRARFHPANEGLLHSVWMFSLIFAYGCHFYAVRSHGYAIGELVRWTNRHAKLAGLTTVRNEAARVGWGPLWIAVVAGGVFGFRAYWMVPMVMAGAAQRRYAEVGTQRLQQSLGQQANAAFALAGTDGGSTRYCPAERCGARLPTEARFCNRCGTPAAVAQPAGG